MTTGAANDLLVLEITDTGELGAGLTAGNVTDSQSSIWALATSHAWNGTGNNQYVFYAIDAVAGADTVTVNSGGASGTTAVNATAILAAFSGVDTDSPIGSVGTFATGTGTSASASVTTTLAPTTILGVLSTGDDATAIAPTTSPSFTQADTVNDGVATASFLEYYGASGAGTFTSGPTWTGSAAWGEVAIAVESPLAVTVSPTSVVLDQGQSVTITASPTGGPGGYTYAWSVSSGTCPGFSTSSSVTLTYTPSGVTGGCILTVTVTDSNSDTAQPTTPTSVTVNAALSAGGVTPAAPVYDVGQVATLTSNPTGGTTPYSRQWYSSTLGTGACNSGTLISGATNPTYVAPTASAGVTYYCYQATDAATTPTSAGSPWDTVTVNTALVTGTVTPATPTYDVGQVATLTANPSSGTSPYSFQWYSSATGTGACNAGTLIAGATSTTYVAPTAAAGATYYCYQVTDSATTPTTGGSAWNKVTVNLALAAGAVTPAAPKYDVGQTATLTSHPTHGTGAYSYQWYSSVIGTGICNAGTLIGAATSSTYVAPTGSVATTYYCYEVTDSATTPTSIGSAWDKVIVNAALVAGGVTPSSPTYDVGQTATLTSHPSLGTAAYTYKWYSSATGAGVCNTGTLIGGATSATYVAPTASVGTTYYCYEVSDSATTPTSANSAWDKVIVNAALVAGAVTPGSPTFDVGQSGAMTSHPSAGTGSYSYQWYSSGSGTGACNAGTLIGGATGPTYTAPTASAGVTYYCYQATDSATTPTSIGSAWDKITVNAALASGSATPSGPTVDSGQSITLTTNPSGGTAAYTYQWYSSSTNSGACNSGSPLGTAVTQLASPVSTTYYCYAVTDSATTPSAAASGWDRVTVNPALTAGGVAPGTPTYDVGQTATLTSTPSGGTTPYSYQWFSSATGSGACNSGTVLTGATSSTFNPSTASAGSTYYCYQVTDSATTPTMAGSAWDLVVVNAALTVGSASPGSPIYDVGQIAVLTSNPSGGTTPYGVQWFSSATGSGTCDLGTLISGATSSTFDPSTASVGATYYCYEVTDSASTPSVADSPWDLITVNPALVAGGVTPAAPTYDVGQVATLSSNPSGGTSPDTLQWYSSATGSGPCTAGTLISGATSSTYDASTASPGTTYFCYLVTDSATTPTNASSAWNLVTVNAALVAGGVTPAAPTYDVGQLATLTSHPSLGTSPYSYQWYSSSTGTGLCGSGTIISGATSSTYAAPTGSAASTYFCYLVTDSATTPIAAGSPWNLVVVNPALIAGGVTPSAPIYDAGQTATLTSNPSQGTTPYADQWFSSTTGTGGCAGGTLITGATSSTYVAPTVSAGTTYYCYQVTDSATSAVSVGSAWDKVTVNAALAAGGATPAAPTYDVGQTATLTSHPSAGTVAYSYQWYSSATGSGGCSGGTLIAGATSSTYVAPTASASTTYYCYQVTDSATTPSSIGSAWNKVIVNAALAAGAVTPGAPTYDVGQTATLTAHPSAGTGPYSYQWYSSATGSGGCNGGTLIAGATASTYAAPTASPGTTYYCYQVTDSATTPTFIGSAWNKVVVNPALAAAAVTPGSPTYDVGQTATLTSHPSAGSGAYSYQWYSSGTGLGACNAAALIAGATSSTYTAPTASAGTTYYCYQVMDSATTPTSIGSAWDKVIVNAALLASGTTPGSPTFDVGQPSTLTSHPSAGTGSYSYQWYSSATGTGACNSGSSIAGATTSTYVAPTVSAGTTYYCYQVTDSATTPTSIGSTWDKVIVNTALVAGGATPAAPTYDVGQPATMTSHPSSGTGPYSYQWYSSTTGTGGCSGGTLISGATSTTYNPSTASASATFYCYQVTDSATTPTNAGSVWDLVTVNAALGSGSVTPVSPTYDVGQPAMLGANPTGGTTPYAFQWYSSATGAGACNLGTSIAGATTSTYTPSTSSPGAVYYCYEVSDSASTPTSTGSGWDLVTVNIDLAPGSPTPGSAVLDNGQSTTLTANPSGGTTPYLFQWYSGGTSGACTGLGSPISGATSSTYLATPASTTFYCYTVTDSSDGTGGPASATSTADAVTVNSALTASSTPSVSATTLDSDQVLNITSTIPTTGTAPYGWDWRVSVNGVAYAPTTLCQVNSGTGASGGALETCTIDGGMLTPGDTYGFKLRVNDSASTPESVPSLASLTVTVNSPLTAPSTPSPSATNLDADQGLTVTASLPSSGSSPYQFEWLFSVGAGYALATMCTPASGSGALAGAVENCVVSPGSLTPGDVYSFELALNDSATTAETQTSSSSATVTVASALTTPGAPAVSSNPVVDRGQTSTLTATVPSSGTAPYSWQWLYSTDGGVTFNPATTVQCTTPSGSGTGAGSIETCSFVTTGSTAPGGYKFEFRVTDSATSAETQTSTPSISITVHTALTAAATPTPSVTSLDADQAMNVTATIPATGTSPYSWEWLVEVGGVGGYAPATECGSSEFGSGASAGAHVTCVIPGNTLSASTSYSFELSVTDSASTHETKVSPASATVTTSSALTAGTPSPTSPTVDLGQSISLGTTASGGSGNNTYQWYSGATAIGCTSLSTPIAGANASTYLASPGTTTYYCYLVTDSNLANGTSTAVALTVNSALTAPAAPGVGATLLDVDQVLTVTGTLPTTGSPTYSWTWWISIDAGAFTLTTQCAVNSGSGASGGALETCSIAAGTLTAGKTYAFKLQVTDSASSAETKRSLGSSTVAVSSALTSPAVPSPSGVALDTDQVLTISGSVPSTGTSPYAWQWWVSVNGGTYADATLCATNSGTGASGGAPEACVIAAGTLTAGDDYTFEIHVTDSASAPESQTSAGSSVVMATAALTAPATPTVSALALDADQAETVTGSIPSNGAPTYAWTWMVSVNGAPYAPASQCATNGGSGASAGQVETCAIAANTLTAGSAYSFELRVSDSASTPESHTSSASSAVAVAAALTAPAAPTASAPALDVDQSLTISGTVPTTGTSTYSWKWFVSIDGGAYQASTQCAQNAGVGASGGAVERCSIAAGVLTVGSTYSFRLVVKDAASTPETQTSAASSAVVVRSALTPAAAPTLSAVALDVDQSLTVTGTLPTTGTSFYSWSWQVSVNGGPYTLAAACAVDGGSGALGGALETCRVASNSLTPGDTYTFQLNVSDSASVRETTESAASLSLTVGSALGTPATPTASAAALDVDQALTVTGFLPLTGTPSYTWQWWVSVDGGPYGVATLCATNGGNGGSGGDAEICLLAASVLSAGGTYAFELQVTDHASSPESSASAGSPTVRTAPALTSPSAPKTSALAFNLSLPLTVSGTIPTSGTSTYSWQWLIAVNGGAFAPATPCGASASGSGAAAGVVEQCVVPGRTLTASSSYTFELEITDSASLPEIVYSLSSSTVVATSPSIAFAPGQGPMGGSYTVTGSGFAPNSGATIAFALTLQTPRGCTVGTFVGTSLTTDSTGGFVCTFTVPTTVAGAYPVNAEDTASSTLSFVRPFLVTSPAIVVSPSQGAPGSSVTVTGTGFSVSTTLASIVFGSKTIPSCTSGSLTTDSSGSFRCTFSVPDGTSGSAVIVTDAGGQRASSTFTATKPAGFPWVWVIAAVLAVVVALSALVVARRRRKAPQPRQELPAEAPEVVAPFAGAAPEAATPFMEPTPWAEPSAPSAPTHPYTEELEVPVPPVAPVSSAPAPPADAQLDVDSVLAELDEISGSILKATPKKTTGFRQGDTTSKSTEGAKEE